MSTLYEKDALNYMEHVKTISFPDGSWYDFLLLEGLVPAIRNGKTRKVVRFEWNELLILAIDIEARHEASGDGHE
ncbi:MAG: hypothetical protein ACXW1Z_19830 [Methylobacter sp.]